MEEITCRKNDRTYLEDDFQVDSMEQQNVFLFVCLLCTGFLSWDGILPGFSGGWKGMKTTGCLYNNISTESGEANHPTMVCHPCA